MADLTITIDVRDGQTMSRYAVPKNKKLTFANSHATDQLKVAVKEVGDTPFCENDKVTEILEITVPAGGEETVRICDAFTADEFLYTAQIGTAAEEDPIVIIEPSSGSPGILFMLALAAIGGAIVGVLGGYILASSRQSRAKTTAG